MSYVEIYILRLSALVPQLTVTKNSELIYVAAGILSNYGGDLVLSFYNRQDRPENKILLRTRLS